MFTSVIPNNPTGTTLTKTELQKWVGYALANNTLILFNVAYEAYIQEPGIPHSIYEIKGVKKCALLLGKDAKRGEFLALLRANAL